MNVASMLVVSLIRTVNTPEQQTRWLFSNKLHTSYKEQQGQKARHISFDECAFGSNDGWSRETNWIAGHRSGYVVREEASGCSFLLSDGFEPLGLWWSHRPLKASKWSQWTGDNTLESMVSAKTVCPWINSKMANNDFNNQLKTQFTQITNFFQHQYQLSDNVCYPQSHIFVGTASYQMSSLMKTIWVTGTVLLLNFINTILNAVCTKTMHLLGNGVEEKTSEAGISTQYCLRWNILV